MDSHLPQAPVPPAPSNSELRILQLEQELNLTKAAHGSTNDKLNYLSEKHNELLSKYSELEAKRSETQGLLEMAESKYAELKLQYDAGFSSFLNTFLKIDEETLSRFVSNKLCAYIEDLACSPQLPPDVDRALTETAQEMVSAAIKNVDCMGDAENAVSEAVEDAMNRIDVRVNFRN